MPNDSTKRLVAAALVLAMLTLWVPFLAKRLQSKGMQVSVIQPLGPRSPRPSEAEDFFAFVTSLPSYQALKASLEEFAATSSEFLQAAAEDNPESLPISAQNYRESLRQVRDNFELLADRVGRDRAASALIKLRRSVNERVPDHLIVCLQQQKQE